MPVMPHHHCLAIFLSKLRSKLPAISDFSKIRFFGFPVPRFTAPQAELYEAVLEIQRECLTLCSPGTSLETIYNMMLTLIGQKLKELGIVKNIKENSGFKVLHSFDPSSQLGFWLI